MFHFKSFVLILNITIKIKIIVQKFDNGADFDVLLFDVVFVDDVIFLSLVIFLDWIAFGSVKFERVFHKIQIYI